ncbi:MAG TPA: LD-carboxypeptidase [Flavitalea sp.]|nr:LD-carboxypeptidase [Flavitalea sp.]
MVKLPPSLKQGDTIGLVCPAGYMALEKVQSCIDSLRNWGYQTRTGKTVGNVTENYFSGSDRERLDDLQSMLDDDTIHAIFCARGGYGLTRIIDQLNFKKFRKNPKWIIGFSDVTILHVHIYSNYKIATLHAPMAAAFNNGESENPFVQSLKKALEGKKMKYQVDPHEYNRKGEAIGELIGGNLTLLAHLVGTESDFSTRGRILFLEDVGEYLYNIDRMLYQLSRSGKLSRLAGLIVGRFTDNKDTERPFGKSVYEIIRAHTRNFDYPVAFNFPVSHEKENFALKHGKGYKLTIGKNKVILEE